MNHSNRKHIRLPGYDYRCTGVYFLTICTVDRLPILGLIRDGVVELSSLGNIVQQAWIELPYHYQHLMVDSYVVMPNHFHGILCLTSNRIEVAFSPRRFGHLESGSLSSIIRSFKAGITRCAGWNRKLWQAGFYEHIIRNEGDLMNHREYIQNNPLQWELDEEYVL
jgi:REP element-mobilizing transposase RayT